MDARRARVSSVANVFFILAFKRLLSTYPLLPRPQGKARPSLRQVFVKCLPLPLAKGLHPSGPQGTWGRGEGRFASERRARPF